MKTVFFRYAAFAALGALLLGGCAGPTPGQSSIAGAAVQPAQAAAMATLPPCAGAGSPVALPAAFPPDFPLPPGSIVTGQQPRTGGLSINVVTPMGARSVAVYLKQELGAGGFKSGEGDSEPGEAEAPWAGRGYIGRWKARDIQGCPGAATLEVYAGK